ncbi:hypothetical protein C0J52_10571 [Blattella germanica]|nr:hypothetical protein C0J52_10571 [Blattella germanica]PSN53121.1 hypothetical protein C0J52_10571 [Blattella germanica]PSN53122.1 hypothetical protein C0J52_10571 [Blattella germanica]
MVCLGFSALAIISEGIKIYQNHLKLKAKSNSQHCHSSRCSSETEMLLSNEDSGNQTSKWLTALKITTVYTLQMTVSYLLMLIVMTYNGYFTIALALGGLVGYLLFGSVLYNWEDKHLLKKKCHSCLGKSSYVTIYFSLQLHNIINNLLVVNLVELCYRFHNSSFAM